MATYNKFQPFVEYVYKGKIDFTPSTGHTFKIFLCAAANAPVATNGLLANLTTASTANLDTTTVVVGTAAQTSGTLTVLFNDLTVTSTGGTTGPFRYVGIYDDTPTSPVDPLVMWYDYGSEITLALNETFLLDFTTSTFTAT